MRRHYEITGICSTTVSSGVRQGDSDLCFLDCCQIVSLDSLLWGTRGQSTVSDHKQRCLSLLVYDFRSRTLPTNATI